MTPIAITIGEPAGVGPDVLLKLANHAFARPLVVITDRHLLQDRAKRLNLKVDLPLYEPNQILPPLSVEHQPLKVMCEPGKPNSANAKAVVATLKRAVAGCMQGEFSALATGPINKAVINAGGIHFRGHTELLAELSHTQSKVVMLFVYENLRLALITIHVPLSEVPHLITSENIENTLRVIQHDLQSRFHIKNPKILLLGLNPHAGEQGCIGREEITIIQPTIQKLQKEGMQILGPIPADTAFWWIEKNPVDVIVSHYHDQSLPVVKTLGLGNVVNVTLGLPFVRTSVDHGTAFDIAGTDQADPTSLIAAINLAIHMTTPQ